MSLNDLIAVRTFGNRMEAEFARTVLEAAGIQAVVRHDDGGGAQPSLWVTGVDLLVRPTDLNAADAVLKTPAVYAAENSGSGDEIRPSVYDFDVTTIDGQRIRLETYRGHVLLIVNVASFCGYTPQYRALEAMYRAHQAEGFVVLGFPCDQFGHQEPGSDAEILAGCRDNYDVTFPMFSKIKVNGPEAHPLFRFLKAEKRGWLGSESIKWNFTKFLVDRQGHVVERYGSTDAPESIEPDIIRALSTT